MVRGPDSPSDDLDVIRARRTLPLLKGLGLIRTLARTLTAVCMACITITALACMIIYVFKVIPGLPDLCNVPFSSSASGTAANIPPSAVDKLEPFPSLEALTAPTQNGRNLRARVFPHIDPSEIYLDWTGAGLYQAGQVARSQARLTGQLLCNPHSISPCSDRADVAIERTRREVLSFFGASPEEYALVFTSGATAALKLVAESLNFTDGSELAMLSDNHQSVLAMREPAADRGAAVSVIDPADFISAAARSDSASSGSMLDAWAVGANSVAPVGLLAFPAQSNYNGAKYPLEMLQDVGSHRSGLGARALALGLPSDNQWLTLLDAAAFVPSSPLNLTKTPADFVTLSFYKMFGFPSGLGGLIIRHSAASHLVKRFHGGGTVVAAGPTADSQGGGPVWSFLKEKHDVCARFEDGTVNFLGIPALSDGLEALNALGGMFKINNHVFAVARRVAEQLAALRHSNGTPVVDLGGHWPGVLAGIYSSEEAARAAQGGVINFMLSSASGKPVGYHSFVEAAFDANINVRAGLLCNPGAAFREECTISEEDAAKFIAFKQSCGDPNDVYNEKHAGGIRISVGYSTTNSDVDRLLELVRSKFVQ